MKGEVGQTTRIEITESGSGRVMVRGELTFATARLARDIGVRVLAASGAERIVVDDAEPGIGLARRPARVLWLCYPWNESIVSLTIGSLP